MKKLLLLLCFVFIHQVVYPVYFKHLGMSDGLSQVSVMSIYQDCLGRMWFGTREGVSIYDGERMRVYKGWENLDPESSINVLLGHECDHLTGNRQGDIFFRTCDSLVRYDIREEKFCVVSGCKAKTINSADGDIWTGYDDMVCRYDEKGDSLQLYAKTNTPGISSLLISGKKIWIGTYEGLYVIEEDKKVRCLIEGPEFYRLFESSTGEIWAGCRTGGLYRITQDERITWYSESNSAPFHIKNSQIRSFAEDRFGNIWFGTFMGLHKYTPYTDQFTVYQQDHLPGSLSHSSVFSVYIDAQETIWVGTYYGGVNYFNAEREIFAHYTDNPLRKECLNYSFVGNLAEDKEGNIWICTEGGGLNFMDRKTRTFKYFTAGHRNSVLQNNLKCIAYDGKRNRLYIGTHHGGLTRYDIKTGIFHNYLNDYREGDIKPDGIIFHTMIHNDRLYVSAMNGTFAMDLDTDRFQWICRNAQSFTIDSEENLWILIGTSLYKMELAHPDNQKHYALPRYGIQFEPKRIMTTRTGDIYFVVLGGGLYRYDKQTDSFIHYSQESGHLLSNYCYNVAETNSEELLVTSDKGVTFLNPFSGNIYITEAYNYTVKGDVLCFNQQGQLQYRLNDIGLNPNTVVFSDKASQNEAGDTPEDPNAPSAFANKVFEYIPAPGQFINTTTSAYEDGFSAKQVLERATEKLKKKSVISLGGFGGTITVGFHQSIRNSKGEYDFRILGNASYNQNTGTGALGGSAEPGIVLVSKDENGNGLPDDEWYELAGSEYGKDTETRNYEITYYRPQPANGDIRWTDNQGGEGFVYRNSYHQQDSYYPNWIKEDEITFRGTRLKDNAINEGGTWVGYCYPWGYADNHPNRSEFSQFKIDWAVDQNGNHVELDKIDFVKIYTAVNQNVGWMGEISTEVMTVEDLHFEN